MAALWLRLRRAAFAQGKQLGPHIPGNNPSRLTLTAGRGAHDGCGEARKGGDDGAGGAFGVSEADGAVDLSRVGLALFESRDPNSSGIVSQAVFREVSAWQNPERTFCFYGGWRNVGDALHDRHLRLATQTGFAYRKQVIQISHCS